jgi:hypothetical protein
MHSESEWGMCTHGCVCTYIQYIQITHSESEWGMYMQAFWVWVVRNVYACILSLSEESICMHSESEWGMYIHLWVCEITDFFCSTFAVRLIFRLGNVYGCILSLNEECICMHSESTVLEFVFAAILLHMEGSRNHWSFRLENVCLCILSLGAPVMNHSLYICMHLWCVIARSSKPAHCDKSDDWNQSLATQCICTRYKQHKLVFLWCLVNQSLAIHCMYIQL